IILKVMSGDKVDVSVQYYYNSTGTGGGNLSSSDLLNVLASGLVSVSGGLHGSFTDLTGGSSPLPSAITSFVNSNNPQQGSSKPQAFLNWILLDDQFKIVGTYPQSGAVAVGSAGTTGGGTLQSPLGYTGIPVTKSGYLYIYVSNSTPGWDVFFDNLSVKTYSGPMLEENHYYPFGLTMAQISDKAIKTQYAENRYRANGGDELQNKEFSDGSGLESYDAFFRMYDPQIGRFWQQDPLADASEDWSPYSFVQDNPVSFNDPLGLTDSVPDVTNIGAKGVKAYAPAPVVVGHKANCKTCTPNSNSGTSTARESPVAPPPPNEVPSPTPKPVVEPTPEPIPTPEPEPILETPELLPAALPAALTTVLVFIPITGTPKTHPEDELYYARPQPEPNFEPFMGHANRKDNSNPHIVYEFMFAPPKGDTRTPYLKYGISDEYRYSLERPENQLPGLRARFGASVMYRIITRTINRQSALVIEDKLVNDHIVTWGERPRDQDRP
ncbi:RHS repeat-associated core domain-containing protein, partial [Puia dinghuensis]|uniref:RHS repeat-associated core domain-containing protein n=1 Tax=Puia dinghuensis TaxID=1792502 RepID=UPI001663D646